MKLEFDGIMLEFGMHRVLSDIHMACKQGQVVGLLGRNGAGKSCLMQVVFGSLRAAQKSVRVDGQYLAGNYMKDQWIAYLPQGDLLPNFITISQALALFGVSQTRVEANFPEAKEFMNRRSSEVSAGQRRLFEVLLILFATHPFCFLDEPFSGLMPVHAELLAGIIQLEKSRKGIIISDHLHRHVRGISDKLYLLTNGKTHLINSEDRLVELGYLVGI